MAAQNPDAGLPGCRGELLNVAIRSTQNSTAAQLTPRFCAAVTCRGLSLSACVSLSLFPASVCHCPRMRSAATGFRGAPADLDVPAFRETWDLGIAMGGYPSSADKLTSLPTSKA